MQKRVKRNFPQKAVRVGDITAVSASKYFLRCFNDVCVSGGKYGNYWSDNSAFDLDGDGIADTAYKPNGITDQILWRAPAARLLMNSPAVTIVKWAQKNFPAIMPGGMTDSKPLMVMPETETLKKLRELKAGAQKTG